jgi:ABC-2 type transport system ATP-binding protein
VGDVLELQGLTRRYGDLVALDDLSFTVAEGQMFGFVGPNGAGKTTAMRIVLAVLEPDAGQVLWRGSPIDEQTRRRTGYMPEDHGQTFLRQCADARSVRVQGA